MLCVDVFAKQLHVHEVEYYLHRHFKKLLSCWPWARPFYTRMGEQQSPTMHDPIIHHSHIGGFLMDMSVNVMSNCI